MVKNLLWDLSGKLFAQTVSLVVSLVLTRLLSPEDFGVMGIALVFIFVSSAFLDMGFSRALVQQKDISKPQLSSVFFLNLAIGVFLALLLFFLAGPIARVYRHGSLEKVLKTLAIVFTLNAVAIVPGAVLAREMKFKFISIAAILSALVSGCISIWMAYHGFGIWSLVTQQVLAAFLTATLLFYFSRWVPGFVLDMNGLRPLWLYGGRMFAASMISSLVNRLDVFIIGKLYSTASLGYYARAQSFENFFRNMTTNSLTAVFFPVVSRLQDRREMLVPLYLKYLHLTACLSAGLVGLLYLVTPDLFLLMFTEKWNTAAGYFQLMMLAGFGWPVSALMLTLIAALGNARVFLNLEIFRTCVLVPVMVAGIYHGIGPYLLMLIVVRFSFLFVNVEMVSREMKISVLSQVRVIGTYLLSALLGVLASWAMLNFMPWKQHMARIALGSLTFLAIYFLSLLLVRARALHELRHFILRGHAYLRKRDSQVL